MSVNQILGATTFNRFHFWMLFWACFIITFDMYDLVIYGSVLPVLIKEWSMSPVQAGAIGSYGFLGMMVGAVVFGMLADRLGRQRVLVVSVVLFSGATVLCGFTSTALTFSVFRFLAGLGIGGILPTVIAIVTDYAPAKRANSMVAIVMCFFSVGGILAALIALNLMPSFGWQSVYRVGALPLLLLPFMIRYLPDAPAVILRRRGPEVLRSVLSRVTGRDVTASEVGLAGREEKPTGAPVRALFSDGRATGTLMIWIAFFMCLLLVNGLSVWLPQLMVQAGYALGAGLTFLIVLNVGAVVGTLFLGRLADRRGAKLVLVPMYAVAAVSLALLGFGSSTATLLLLVAVTGACAMGAQNLSYAFVSQYYPSPVRSTAIGLASAVGRIGAIVGPTFGGVLLTLGLPVQTNFLFFAVPGLAAALAFWFVPLARRVSVDAGVEAAR
jgi:AAHS family benzoate transporter-like MFS transporter